MQLYSPFLVEKKQKEKKKIENQTSHKGNDKKST